MSLSFAILSEKIEVLVTTMQEDIDSLKKVQILDKEIYDLGVFLSQTPARVSVIEENFESKKSRFNQLEEEVKKIKLNVKEKELELGKKDSEIKKLDGQLSQVKTNKEYSTMLQEIASVKADKGILEEQILAEWDSVEKINQDRDREKKILAQEEEKLKAEKQKLEEETKKAEEKIKQLKGQRQDLLLPITSEVKDLYEKILPKREGVALVKIDGENCAGCQVLLRPQIINEVRLQEKITLCESCSRILYYES